MRVVVDTNVAFSALAAGCENLAIRLLSPSELSFPKWGFGNARIAGKLCFAVRGWPRN